MKSDELAVRRLLGPHDPVPPAVEDRDLPGRPAQTLTRILSARPAPAPASVRRVPRSKRAFAAVAAVLLLVAATVVVGTAPRSRAYAATPAPLQLPEGPGRPARSALLRLAAVAAAQPPPGGGRYRYLKLQAWYLDTAVAGDSVASQLEPQVIERWVAANGAMRTVTRRDGSSDVVTERATRTPPAADRLSTDPRRLARQLLGYPNLSHDDAGVPNAAERTQRAVDVLRDATPVRPALQAALWRVLAAQHLAGHGPIVDRAGRRGLAFTIDTDASGLPTRDVLVIDPATGGLLSFEQVLTKRAGRLDVRIPSVTAYEIFRTSGTVATDTAAPPGAER